MSLAPIINGGLGFGIFEEFFRDPFMAHRLRSRLASVCTTGVELERGSQDSRLAVIGHRIGPGDLGAPAARVADAHA